MHAPQVLSVASTPRAVPLTHVFAWFEAAMRIFKRAPLRWCVLGFITIGSEFLLDLVPGIGVAAAKVIEPVIECGMLIGAAAVDRGAPLQIRFAVAAFKAPASALAAIVLPALLVSAIETAVGYALTGANLLADPSDARLTPVALLAVGAAATLASLPFIFVPMAVLLAHAGFGRALASSVRAFTLNIAPLVLFGLLSLGLTLVGVMVYMIGLIAVAPLLAAASYAAWKDIFGSAAAP